jgi:hypothetical protein
VEEKERIEADEKLARALAAEELRQADLRKTTVKQEPRAPATTPVGTPSKKVTEIDLTLESDSDHASDLKHVVVKREAEGKKEKTPVKVRLSCITQCTRDTIDLTAHQGSARKRDQPVEGKRKRNKSKKFHAVRS